ncbi:hypothetical protein ACI3EQ_16105, partial [Ornithinimicrobium sp. LYQ103]
SLIVSFTVRTARSRSSSLYFLGAGMTPLSRRDQDPPPNPGRFNPLLRVAGISEDLSEVVGRRVDVVTAALLRDEVSSIALSDAVPV